MTNAGGPKVVLLGAGSAFFGRQTVWSMVMKEALCGGTLALVDPDEEKLGWLEGIARRAIEARGVPLQLEVATSHESVLKDADFVILAFAVEGVELRGVDAEISTRHGMIMCSADTVGPGGIMRTVREVPRQHRILKDVERICPDAWVINWVNPTSAMGIAMMRHFPKMRSIALCDGPHNPRFDNNLIVRAGLAETAEDITPALRSRVNIRSGGINHFNWLVEMTHEGRDLLSVVKEAMRQDDQTIHRAQTEEGKPELANCIGWQLADSIGYVPMCVWHTQEYVPYFQGHDVDNAGALTIRQWSVEGRRDWMNDCWTDMRNIASGERTMADFLEKTTPDHASDIIEAMWAGLPKTFYINVRNGGAITNMTDDAFVEVPCVVDLNAVRPLPFGEMPRPLVGYMQRVLDEHELAVEAGMTCDRATLLKAFLASMVTVSIPDAKRCMEEQLEAERQYLPEEWFQGA